MTSFFILTLCLRGRLWLPVESFHNIMKPYKQNGSRGAFTLIELVISIVIMAIVAGITIHYLVSAGRLYALLLAQKQAESEVTDAVSRMRREARLHLQTLTANSNEWTFSKTDNTTNTFRWSGSDVTLSNYPLARGVQRFVFSYYNATNGLLDLLPLSTSDCALISRVALDLKATNSLTDSELKINFFLQNDLIK